MFCSSGTDRHIVTKVKTENTLSEFQEFLNVPLTIIKERSNISHSSLCLIYPTHCCVRVIQLVVVSEAFIICVGSGPLQLGIVLV